ncbi:hypothetical protein OIN60_08965 [Paenibacillus sp. P96]|uniref:Uncharacterized protein n=1 Tax=Paenibacillus zeirhizosphaerae TaxID=2987519 RepID=A0ABT9FQ85_9BACL|nr:hypothetical protein [Paenibacillus sp. P96]MDP4096901.1 hypothetical protein [Paenibacillus sp. P96]
MRQWIGRQVIVHYEEDGMIQIRGTVERMNYADKCLILGPKMQSIPFEQISVIEPLNADHKGRSRRRLNSVGYVMSDMLQFDNAVYFQSAVTVWQGEQLVAYNLRIRSHDRNFAVMADGRKLSKDTCTFVVRSLRG